MRSIKPSFSIPAPRHFPHLNQNGAPRRTGTYKQAAEKLHVERENRRVHGSLQKIYAEDVGATPLARQMMLETGTRIAAGLEENKASTYEVGRERKREEERIRIERDNARIHRRLVTIRPCMDRRQWERHADRCAAV